MSRRRTSMSALELVLLVLRVTLELAVVAALAYWGVQVGSGPVADVALGISAPVVGFGLWGAVDFRQAGRYAEALRLTQELAISMVAAAALFSSGQHPGGIALALLSVAYHGLVYASGATLLHPQHSTR